MRQVLSWALARSPGDRSRAQARLAAFREAGLLRPRQGASTRVAGAVVALAGQHDQPGGGQLAEMPQILAAVRSCTAPGSGPDTHRTPPPGRR